MNVNGEFSKTPIQHAIQYTIYISLIYIAFKYFDMNSPDGKKFISYISVTLFSDIVLIAFPLLFIFFYFKDGNAVKEIKNELFNGSCFQTKELETLSALREYHALLKEGIITQEEFDNIKSKQLKELNKSK